MRKLAAGAALALGMTVAEAATLDTLDLNSFKGKVVLVDFFASWCVPCKESFPWMQQILNRYGDRGLVVVAVNVDRDRQAAQQFLNELNPSFPIVFDPRAELAKRFKVGGMPASFYIDRNGTVRFTHIGFHAKEADGAEHELAKLLAE